MLEAWPEEAASFIREVLNATGHNRRQAAKALGVSRSTFYAVVKDLDIELLPTHMDIRPPRDSVILSLMQCKGNRREAARRYGVVPTTLWRWCTAYNIKVPSSRSAYWAAFEDGADE